MFDFSSFNPKNWHNNPAKQTQDEWHTTAVTECADGTWDYLAKQQHLFLSPKLKMLTGYEETEMAHSPLAWWIDKTHPHDQQELGQKIKELKEGNSEFIYWEAMRFLCKNNEYIWLENHIKVLRDENNQLVRLAGVIFNITPHKLIQNQLRGVIAGQERSARNRIRFLSALNHDLRSPLSGIIGMVSLLKEKALSVEQSRYVDNISNASEMMLTLVNDILDVSKLTSGKFEFENIRFSLLRVIQQAAEMIRSPIIRKNLTFNQFVDKNLPSFVMGDPTRLQQILVNLLSNAAKFTSQGSITMVVKVKPGTDGLAERLAPALYFEVSDTGIGIAPEVQGKLFEDFTQGNTSVNRLYGGTGLGLSICKELVHLMKGRIGLKSTPGKGSIFWFEIPFSSCENSLGANSLSENSLGENSASENHNGTTPAAPSGVPEVKSLNILLAEDNHVNQEVMIGLLSLSGDKVTLANNGQEAVNLFQSHTFDIVLMDLNMPVLDGLSATKIIRQLPNGHIPIIAVTANTFTGDRDTCLYYGITDVLNKPINKITLQQALSTYRSLVPASGNERDNDSIPCETVSDFLDRKTLKALANDLGQEKLAKLLTIYRTEGLKLVSQIKNSPLPALGNLAHTLAGMSENLGFYKVGKAARTLMGHNTQAPSCPEKLVQELENNFTSSLNELAALKIF